MKKRTFLRSLIWTKDNDLDLSWCITLLAAIVGLFALILEVAFNKRASIAAWSWLGAVFSAILIAAVPISKARLLANSKMVEGVAKGIASSGNVEQSTDLTEFQTNKDI